MILEYCFYCGKETKTLEIAGGDCEICGLSKVTPKGKEMRYQDKEGKELTLFEWAKLFEDREYATVGRDTVGIVDVSTIWLGLNHGDYYYETCLFLEDGRSEVVERYETLEQAKKGHEKWKSDLKTPRLK